MPDETCTCTCGGVESEDHTPGNGCERRGCTCTYWPPEFENTNNRIEVATWYSIANIPAMKTRKGTMVMPVSAKFTFLDGDCISVGINGKIIKKDGEVSDRTVLVSDVYVWDQSTWPVWLHKLFALAYSDFRDMKVPA